MSAASPAKAKKAAKPRKPAAHPKYIDMIKQAITALKERGGSSRQGIKKYIIANFKVDPKNVNQFMKVALRNGVKKGTLKQIKGSFKVGEKKEAKPKKKVAKKPKKTTKKAKKPAGEKKAAKPKKAAAKKVKKPKSPKKAKSPAKKAAKPKKAAAKKPAKKAAKKSPKKAAKK